MDITLDLPKILFEKEFLLRNSKNKAYSLRSFAKTLDLPPGRVSQLLSGERNFTLNLGEKISKNLGFNPEKKYEFLESIQKAKEYRKATKQQISPVSRSIFEEISRPKQIEIDHFSLISEPHHFALLSLIETNSFVNDTKWMAKRLNQTPFNINLALSRLKRLGYIEEKDGELLLTSPSGLATPTDIPSASIRQSHRTILEETIDNLEEDNVSDRDITSMTMAIDVKKMSQAKEIIKKFRRELCECLEQDPDAKSEVYRLNVQLVPVSTKTDKD